MPRGGHREGSGRKPGSRNKAPTKRKVLSKVKEGQAIADGLVASTKSLFEAMGPYLDAKNKALYANLDITPKNAFESMVMLRDDLQVRYNLARISEMESLKTNKKIAKMQLDELLEHGTIEGKTVKKGEKDTKILKLRGYIEAKYPYLNPQITSLAEQLRMINDRIHMIESGDVNRNVNIFNLFAGQNAPEKLENVTDAIFKLPKDKQEEGDDGK